MNKIDLAFMFISSVIFECLAISMKRVIDTNNIVYISGWVVSISLFMLNIIIFYNQVMKDEDTG